MNARPILKSARAIILTSGLIALSGMVGYAQDVTVPLGSQATLPLGQLYISAPTGVANLGGHSFDLSSGNLIQLGNGQSASFNGSWTNAKAAYLLINSFNTYLYYDQMPAGDVTVTFADGTTLTVPLTIGINLREWRTGSGATVTWVQAADTATPPAWTSTQAWTGTAQAAMGGGSAIIDMLTINLPGTKTVTSITLHDTNSFGNLRLDLAGLTIDPQNPQNPKPACIRPGNSCNTPAAQFSQAWKWQPVLPGATNSNPHH